MRLPIIERRRIEADILKSMYEVLSERIGTDLAISTIREAVSRSAIAHGQSYRATLGKEPDLLDFLDTLSDWTADDALTIDVIESSKEKLRFNVTRCRYAEMYKSMGLANLGEHLSCNRDGKFCTGFNPDIKFERNQTIMEGSEYCDFHYELPTQAKDVG